MSKKAEELIGKRFHMLTVVSIAESMRLPSGNIQQMLNCVCDCGNNTTVSYSHLKFGGTKSCGCLKHKKQFENLIGKKFNNLLVTEHLGQVNIGTGSQYTQLWKCQCDCGVFCNVDSRSLKSGNTKSCGCIQGNSLRLKHLNKYDLSGDYGVGYCSDDSTFLFDLEDYNSIKNFTWYKNDHGYLVTTYKGKRYRMHRLITGLLNDTSGKVVDHVNHNVCDNRKSNLRVCSQRENSFNKSVPSNNTSGHIGVGKNKRNDKYRAYIGKDRRQYSLGEFEKLEDAINARETGEKEYFSEFAIERNNI